MSWKNVKNIVKKYSQSTVPYEEHYAEEWNFSTYRFSAWWGGYIFSSSSSSWIRHFCFK
jgi:hypothetical protein